MTNINLSIRFIGIFLNKSEFVDVGFIKTRYRRELAGTASFKITIKTQFIFLMPFN